MNMNKEVDKINQASRALSVESLRLQGVLDSYATLVNQIECVVQGSKSKCAEDIKVILDKHYMIAMDDE